MQLLLISFFLISSLLSQGQVIADIKFTGIRRMNITFLEKLIKTKKEHVLDSLLLQNDVQILNRLNGISNAVFTVENLENSSLVNIIFLITENYSLIPTLNIGTTQTNGTYRLGLYEYNFLGKNNTIGGFYQYNDFNSGGLSFSSPQLFSAKLGASLSLHKLTSLEPIFFNQSSARYVYSNSAADITVNYNFNAKNEIKFGAVVFKEKYQYADGALDADIPLQLILNKKLLKAQYIYDNLQYDYYLVQGFKSNLIVQGVVT